MHLKQFLRTLFIGSILIGLFNGCSTEKATTINKSYHNMTARYNGYYNAQVIVDEQLFDYRESFQDDYTGILPLDPYPNAEDAALMAPKLDEALEKCERVIQLHRMPNPEKVKNKKVEHCKWIDDNWLVIGQIHYVKNENDLATQKLKYLTTDFIGEESVYAGKIWLAKIYIREGNTPEANRILKGLETVIEDSKEKAEKQKLTKTQKKRAKKKEEENEKKGIREPAKFPVEMILDYELTWAELYISQNEHKKAITHLEKAIAECGMLKRRRKARYEFILAQLYQALNNDAQAAQHFDRVAKSNAPYEMRFKAKINKSLCVSQGSSSQITKELNKMLKDGKNFEFRDQIYYALAELNIKESDVPEAKRNYTRSALYSVNNNRQKGISYLRLADLNFDEQNYLNAQKYYDSCVSFLPEDYPNYSKLKSKAEGLSDLVFHYETVVFVQAHMTNSG